MLSFRNITSTAKQKHGDQAKSLQKLKRQDLLELLLEEMRANSQLNSDLAQAKEETKSLAELADRLKAKLDVKDAQIQVLRAKLDEKDALVTDICGHARSMSQAGEAERLAELQQIDEILAGHFLRGYVDPALPVETSEPGVDSPDQNTAGEQVIAVANEPEFVLEPIAPEKAETTELQKEECISADSPEIVTAEVPGPAPKHIDYLYLEPESIVAREVR